MLQCDQLAKMGNDFWRTPTLTATLLGQRTVIDTLYNVALLSYRLLSEVVLTNHRINDRGSVLTTGLRSMPQAINMALSNEVLKRLLLSYIDFGVNKLHQQRTIRLAIPATKTAVLGARALALDPTSEATTIGSAASFRALLLAGAVMRAQAHASTPSDETTGRADPSATPSPCDAGAAQPLCRSPHH